MGPKYPLSWSHSSKEQEIMLAKNFLLNFDVFHSKWMVAVEMVFDLSYCFYYLFKTEGARKMQFLSLQRKKNRCCSIKI